MNDHKEYKYNLKLSAKDKVLYEKLARYIGKSNAGLIIKLYYSYHDIVDRGGERLNRIRDAVSFGTEKPGRSGEAVMVRFLPDEKEMIYSAAAANGRSIRQYIVELVQCGLADCSISDDNTSESIGIDEVRVKRKPGRPKGRKNNKTLLEEKIRREEDLQKEHTNGVGGAAGDDSEQVGSSSGMPGREVSGVNDELSDSDIFALLNKGGISAL